VLSKWIAAALLVAASGALAVDAPPASEDPALEKRVMQLAEELRCLVCQNQTIADSHAELAVDLRNQVRDMLREGKSDQEIKDYMVQRYGDFVLYRPPVKATTTLLWVGPFALLIGGLAFLLFKLRQRARRQVAETTELSEADHRKAADLLGDSASADREGKS
jgi:cytochrome c-type biogenesis protein CcmH